MWVHLDHFSFGTIPYIHEKASIAQGLDLALSTAYAPCGRLWIRHTRLPESTWVVRTYRIVWERSKVRFRMEVFRSSHFQNRLDEWNAYDVEVSDFLVHVDYYRDHS